MDTTLTANDYRTLYEDLFEVWDKPKALGILLNLPESTLDEILTNNSRSDICLLEILDTFVEQEDQRPTWRIVLDALRNPLINNPRLAERIEKRLSGISPTQQGLRNASNAVLQPHNVVEVHRRLCDIKSKFKAFGRLLKVPRDHIKSIHEEHLEPETCLFHIIRAFVQQKEPRPTWGVILVALRSPLIGNPRLAGRIERINGFSPSTQLGWVKSKSLDDRLDESDAGEVVSELFTVKLKCNTLGLLLKLDSVEMEVISMEFADPQDQLFRIIDLFLMNKDFTPTWRTILEALRNPLMNNATLADHIGKNFTDSVDVPAIKKSTSWQMTRGLDAEFERTDAIVILQEIIEVKAKYLIFGRLLNIHDAIYYQYRDPQDCLLQIIEYFIKQYDPYPTWRVIINTLRHPLLNYSDLAQKIERKYAVPQEEKEVPLDEAEALTEGLMQTQKQFSGGLDATFELEDSLLILQEIIEVKARSDIFGRLLQLGRLEVNIIHRDFSDPQDRLLQVIDQFIKNDHKRTWRGIINALRHPLLNHNELAHEIERKYAGEEISALDERSPKSGSSGKTPSSLDSIMDPDDATEILQEIVEVKDKSETFGHLLRVPRVLLYSFRQEYNDPQDYLLHVIDEFLNGVNPRPTWRVIIDALRHPLLKYYELAREIESKHSGNNFYPCIVIS
jgi:hypothetical protein